MMKRVKYEVLAFICRQNYKKVLKRLKNKICLKVVFLVTENSKWGYQSVYEEMENSTNFEPLVVVSVLDGVHKGKDTTRNNLEENYQFFKSRGMNVDYAYRNNKYIDLKEFEPDIVFYEQPWGLPKIYKPMHVSKYALTCYSDYGFPMFDNPLGYRANFHKLLYKIYVNSSLTVERYESYSKNNKTNCIVTGYSKLDTYNDEIIDNSMDIWRDNSKLKVIYAPHHSFEENGLRLATFKRNGQFILNFAKLHPEATWIFKPHPQFKFSLLNNNIMSESEIEKYYKEWQNIGIVYSQGNYFDIFKTSDLLITDCYSFLGEYFPTLKPVIRLVNKDSVQPDLLGQKILKGYYEVDNNSEIEKVYTELLIKSNDYKYNYRKEFLPTIFDKNEKSSKKIIRDLEKILH